MRVDVTWDLPRSQWNEMFAAAGPTPLLQDWAYGQAKALEGWRPRRALIRVDGDAVALAQVLERRLGPVRIGRLNRGPVWLKAVSDDTARAVIDALRAPWRCWKLAAFFLAPELEEQRAGVLSGFIRRKAPQWGSAWLDLEPSADALRKGLDGKWRNMLVGGEKAGLVAEISSELSWLMERYQELMAEKSFSGTPPALIHALAAEGAEMVVLRALAGDEPVAGVLVVRHGAAATYLVGWNGEAGRKLKANHFLLWNAALALKEQGCCWFDLGGIDDALTPGIAAFKRGMKGREYRLAGEYLAL